MTETRVLIASTETLMSSALSILLSREEGLTVRESHEHEPERLARDCRAFDASVVVLDLAQREERPDRLVSRLLRDNPTSPVVALVSVASAETVAQAFAAGARGVICRDASHRELVAAVREVGAGHAYASRSIMSVVLEMIDARTTHVREELLESHELLSEREHAVVEHLMRGMTNMEIARSLHVTEATVKAHLSRVMTKWNVRDRVQVVIRASRVQTFTRSGSLVAAGTGGYRPSANAYVSDRAETPRRTENVHHRKGNVS